MISIIGMGEETRPRLADAANAIITEAEIIFGSKRQLARITCSADKVAWQSPFDRNIALIKEKKNRNIVVLASGDPMWFGVGSTLLHHFAVDELRFFAHASSFNLAASAMAWPLNECYCLSAHGRKLDSFSAKLQPNQRYLVLTDSHTLEKVRQLLARYDGLASECTVLENLSGPNQRQYRLDLNSDALNIDTSLFVLAIRTSAETALHNRLTAGLDDYAFVADGLITKQWMRAISLCRLKPRQSEVLWDIGAGCGSIAIEWTRLCAGTAFAIERDKTRIAHIIENGDTLGASIHIVEGDIDDASIFADLPSPNAIFIGGGLTDIHQLEFFSTILQPHGRLVVNTVTHRGERILYDALAQIGGTLQRFGHETSSKIGDQLTFRPSLRITQWCFENG